MKKTNLWSGVYLVNNSGKKIVIQWRTLPDGTRMALLLGDSQTSVSGHEDELGFFGALMSAAPAIFNMAKKVAPGILKKGADLAKRFLPAQAGKVLTQLTSGTAKSANRQIKAIASGAKPKIRPGIPAPLMLPPPPPSKVRHLAKGAAVPKGYSEVRPVMKISDGAFVD